jgi:hypothetical protein
MPVKAGRCVIDHIVVAANKERIDAKIVWKSGSPTLLSMWRFHGRHNLVGELHAQGLTASEIREHMAAGKTSTGQVVKISLDEVYLSIRKLGLKPHRFAASYASLQRKAAELCRDGRSPKWIAQHFNEQGFMTASGKPWTHFRLYSVLHNVGAKAESFESLHRKAITDARARGLNYQQMAVEFNERNIPRRSGRPWTAPNVKYRCYELYRGRKRKQKEPTGTELPNPVILRRSA